MSAAARQRKKRKNLQPPVKFYKDECHNINLQHFDHKVARVDANSMHGRPGQLGRFYEYLSSSTFSKLE